MNKNIIAIVFGLIVLSSVVIAIEMTKPQVCQDYFNIVDVNHDGRVNTLDMSVVKTNLGRRDCNSENNWCNEADVNFDGWISFQDMDIVRGWLYKKC